MKERDKIISEALKKSFAPDEKKIHELRLGIQKQLPPRRRTNIFVLVTLAASSTLTTLFMLLQWGNIKTILEKLQSIATAPIADKGDTIMYILGVIIVSYIIIWQIFSLIDDYHSIKNEDNLRQILGHRE